MTLNETIIVMDSKRQNLVHEGTVCLTCNKGPIRGARYHCYKCNFDLCEKCEDDDDHEHDLTKIKRVV